MSKIKKRITRIFRKKKSSGENQRSQDDEGYKKRLKKHRRRLLIRILIIAGIVFIGAFIAKTTVDHWKYKNYKVLSYSQNEDTGSTQYTELDGKTLKFSADGAALVGSSGKSLWNQTYEMEAPTADVNESVAVIYSHKGTEMVILGDSGKLGEVNTEFPILKARVASQGGVAAILEDGDNTWINYYSSSGEQITAGKTRVDSPGYPVDLTISKDGLLLMVTYLFVENGTSTSYVAFYNFGNTGQNQMDNMVSGFTYPGVLVPQVTYLNDGIAVAFRDDGFAIYKGKQIPKEGTVVTVEEEIISTCYSSQYIGMVFRSEDADKNYMLRLYNTDGKLMFEKSFNIEYNEVKISKDSILMYNDTELCVISQKGIEKFNGSLDEGIISNIFKTDANRYQLIVENGIKTIKLK